MGKPGRQLTQQQVQDRLYRFRGGSRSGGGTGGVGTAPTVTNVSADVGPIAGGASVVITGTNFVSVSGVFFGIVAAASFVVNSPTQITAITAAGTAGIVDVTVATPQGVSGITPQDQYRFAGAPTVTSLTVLSGLTTGGTSVGIIGTNLASTLAVAFGGVSAAGFEVISDTEVLAVAPPGSLGVVDVTVTTVIGTSVISSADEFTYFTSGGTGSVNEVVSSTLNVINSTGPIVDIELPGGSAPGVQQLVKGYAVQGMSYIADPANSERTSLRIANLDKVSQADVWLAEDAFYEAPVQWSDQAILPLTPTTAYTSGGGAVTSLAVSTGLPCSYPPGFRLTMSNGDIITVGPFATVASGSSGASIETLTTLDVSSTTGFTATTPGQQIEVATNYGIAVFSYTNVTSTSFTGCVLVSFIPTQTATTPVVSTGAGVRQIGVMLSGGGNAKSATSLPIVSQTPSAGAGWATIPAVPTDGHHLPYGSTYISTAGWFGNVSAIAAIGAPVLAYNSSGGGQAQLPAPCTQGATSYTHSGGAVTSIAVTGTPSPGGAYPPNSKITMGNGDVVTVAHWTVPGATTIQIVSQTPSTGVGWQAGATLIPIVEMIFAAGGSEPGRPSWTTEQISLYPNARISYGVGGNQGSEDPTSTFGDWIDVEPFFAAWNLGQATQWVAFVSGLGATPLIYCNLGSGTDDFDPVYDTIGQASRYWVSSTGRSGTESPAISDTWLGFGIVANQFLSPTPSLVPLWVSGTTYPLDFMVSESGTLYVCTTANSDVSFTSGHWAVMPSLDFQLNSVIYSDLTITRTLMSTAVSATSGSGSAGSNVFAAAALQGA